MWEITMLIAGCLLVGFAGGGLWVKGVCAEWTE